MSPEPGRHGGGLIYYSAYQIWGNDKAEMSRAIKGVYHSGVLCDSKLDGWIHKENQLGRTKIFGQVGPVAGANEGLVIASPSNAETNYLYTWTRE